LTDEEKAQLVSIKGGDLSKKAN